MSGLICARWNRMLRAASCGLHTGSIPTVAPAGRLVEDIETAEVRFPWGAKNHQQQPGVH